MAEPEIQMQNPPPRREKVILAVPGKVMGGFLDFIRERGVAGFAIGFILGGATQKLVQSLMDDIINPFIGITFGGVNNLSEYTVGVFKVGNFISVLINFLILCFVVYIVFKLLNLEKLDKPKE